jgi:hypothetical protein
LTLGRLVEVDAAVAFVGKNPEKVLYWPKECLLVTDVSEDRVKAGATSASGVSKLLKRGVDVRSRPGLHAKVYVFDNVAFIGSANASESSQALAEAAVMVTAPAEVVRARRFVRSWSNESTPMSELLMRQLRSLEPKRGFGSPLPKRFADSVRARRQPVFLNGAGLWLDAVSKQKPGRAVERARSQLAKGFERNEEVSSASGVEWTSMDHSTYRVVPSEDWLFVWWEPTSRSPHGRLEGPLRCHGGHDLGRGAGECRYSRAEFGVGKRSIRLTAADVRLLSPFITRRKIVGLREDAYKLHDRLYATRPRRLDKGGLSTALVRLLARR